MANIPHNESSRNVLHDNLAKANAINPRMNQLYYHGACLLRDERDDWKSKYNDLEDVVLSQINERKELEEKIVLLQKDNAKLTLERDTIKCKYKNEMKNKNENRLIVLNLKTDIANLKKKNIELSKESRKEKEIKPYEDICKSSQYKRQAVILNLIETMNAKSLESKTQLAQDICKRTVTYQKNRDEVVEEDIEEDIEEDTEDQHTDKSADDDEEELQPLRVAVPKLLDILDNNLRKAEASASEYWQTFSGENISKILDKYDSLFVDLNLELEDLPMLSAYEMIFKTLKNVKDLAVARELNEEELTKARKAIKSFKIAISKKLLRIKVQSKAHLLISHMPDQLQRFKSMSYFSEQAIESLHASVNMNMYRVTAFGKSKKLVYLMNLQNQRASFNDIKNSL
uniref:DUF4200 domain-containing protein n=1 Tax=Rhabditophanes sp. KR3021 TaxID=114890 RepID=A0AC35TV25_9BILA